ncbi:hypothetical protein LX64_00222 [Chitinophaga skermanii]|uniref:6-phosphogluconate dehydrogenase n=1 Tax=Chitinophaga skermanii TaxID=331697 RepID=A0A327R9L8_9BACT|nr:hypothetical protein [Chitinophaga skermanii]RAJ10617.1 hypothetical protein LX64_00222 [Chitinophaga skermanii]
MRKFLFFVIGGIVLIFTIFFIYKYLYVYADGSKAGELNYFAKKGYMFKTYEGRLIQSGFRGRQPNTLQSNEFTFSVVDEKVAQKLLRCSGKQVEVHYKQYLGALPWRGYSVYIVDSILSVTDPLTLEKEQL